MHRADNGSIVVTVSNDVDVSGSNEARRCRSASASAADLEGGRSSGSKPDIFIGHSYGVGGSVPERVKVGDGNGASHNINDVLEAGIRAGDGESTNTVFVEGFIAVSTHHEATGDEGVAIVFETIGAVATIVITRKITGDGEESATLNSVHNILAVVTTVDGVGVNGKAEAIAGFDDEIAVFLVEYIAEVKCLVKGGIAQPAGVVESEGGIGSEVGVSIAAIVDLKGGVVHPDFDNAAVDV